MLISVLFDGPGLSAYSGFQFSGSGSTALWGSSGSSWCDFVLGLCDSAAGGWAYAILSWASSGCWCNFVSLWSGAVNPDKPRRGCFEIREEGGVKS